MKPEPTIAKDGKDGKETDAPFHDFVMAGVVETTPTDSQPTGQQLARVWSEAIARKIYLESEDFDDGSLSDYPTG